MISTVVSLVALTISIVNVWLTLFRRGTVRMTQPATIFFGPDPSSASPPKVFLRALLYSTAKRGQIIDSMFIKVRRGESTQIFNIWVYGDTSLVRGSGLYIGENGVAYNHHFLLPEDGTKFEFLAGNYTVETYASLANVRTPQLLSTVCVTVSEQAAKQLRDDDQSCLYFDWGPDSQTYHGHIRKLMRGKAGDAPTTAEMFELLHSLERVATLTHSSGDVSSRNLPVASDKP